MLAFHEESDQLGCPEGCNLDGGGSGELLKTLGMFWLKEEESELECFLQNLKS